MGLKSELYGRYIDKCIGATSSTREGLTQFITAINSFHPALKIFDTSLAFLDIKISIEGNDLCTSVYPKPTDSHSYLLHSSSHPSHMTRIPYLFDNFSDFVVYAVTTLVFPKNRRQCASFSINVAILFLSFKRATTAPNKLIDSTCTSANVICCITCTHCKKLYIRNSSENYPLYTNQQRLSC